MLSAIRRAVHLDRAPIPMLAAAVFPLLGVAAFWVFVGLYAALGDDALDWLPGATAVTTAACLPPLGMALAARRRRASWPRLIVYALVALGMTAVWLYATWMVLVVLDGSSGEDWG